MSPQPTLPVSLRLWLDADMYIWVRFSWMQRILRISVWGPSGNLAKEKGSPELISDYRAQRAH